MRKEIPVPGVDITYPLFHKDLRDVIRLLLQRFDGHVRDALSPTRDIMSDLVDGDLYPSLCGKLREAAGEDAVFVPVVLSSGKYLRVALALLIHAQI